MLKTRRSGTGTTQFPIAGCRPAIEGVRSRAVTRAIGTPLADIDKKAATQREYMPTTLAEYMAHAKLPGFGASTGASCIGQLAGVTVEVNREQLDAAIEPTENGSWYAEDLQGEIDFRIFHSNIPFPGRAFEHAMSAR